jgi:hypothetical protein
LLTQEVTDLLTMREVWIEVERRELAATAVELGLDRPDPAEPQASTLSGRVEG